LTLDMIFAAIVRMSVTGSVVTVAVLAARLLLKRAPRVFSHALWAVVLLRLLLPFSVEAPTGIIPATAGSLMGVETRQSIDAAQEGRTDEEGFAAGSAEMRIAAAAPADEAESKAADFNAAKKVKYVWLFGAAALSVLSAVQYIRLRRALAEAVPEGGGVFRADRIDTPFVMGIFRPAIYLPPRLTPQERDYVLAHERRHIRRGDPLWRLLAFAALCLHWFNPFVWAAFILSRRDMEMACDEAVIKELGREVRADYSQTLLRFTVTGGMPVGAPLAFGEGDTKSRVVNVMRYKRPTLQVTVIAALVCAAVAAVFAFNAAGSITAQEALDELEKSIVWDASTGEGAFTLPKDYRPAKNWDIDLSGVTLDQYGNYRPIRFFAEENDGRSWMAGKTYRFTQGYLTGLELRASLPEESGEGVRELYADLFAGGGESADRHVYWQADLNGDGAPERIALDMEEFNEKHYTTPWIEAADGTRLCELDGVSDAHAGWQTYALCELGGRTYLMQYMPYRSTGIAQYGYVLWELGTDGLTAAENSLVEFYAMPRPAPAIDVDALVGFVDRANELWKSSRILFSTDREVASAARYAGEDYYYPIGRYPLICTAGEKISYTEELLWMTDELEAERISAESMTLRERAERYSRLLEKRYEEAAREG